MLNIRIALALCFAITGFINPAVLWAGNGAYVPDEILVRFKPGADEASITAFEQRHGLQLLNEFAHIRVRHYKLPASLSVEAALQQLSSSPVVESVEPNHIRRPMLTPTDPFFSRQWSLHNTGQQVNGIVGPENVDIDWPEAMDLFHANAEVIVAVIDSGVALDHPEIISNAWVNQAEPDLLNGVDEDGNGYIDDRLGWDFFDNDNLPLDENGHGTLVSSIVAGVMNNGEGVTGVASSAKIMALRAFDDFGKGGVGLIGVANFLAATTYAANNGAQIINASFGGISFNSYEVAQIQWLDSQGILLVAAAGNNSADSDRAPQYPAAYSSDNIISVAAIDRDDELAGFSNFGATSVDLAAPGTDIYGADVNRFISASEDFEADVTGWTVGQNPGSQSLDWSLFVDNTGNTWLTDSVDVLFNIADYLSGTDSWAMSPVISVPLVGAQLSYTIVYELSLFTDFTVTEITTDGINWSPLQGTLIGPSLADARKIQADLSAYAGLLVQIRFRLVTDSLFVADGVYIDDIEISEVGLFNYDGTQYQYNNGTSFSAPLVAGVAAMLMAQRPDLTHRQVRQLILDNVTATTALTGLVATGGRLNAHAALKAAIAMPQGNKTDIVVDFGGIGLWARMNDASWLKLNNSSPDQVVVGDVDGNGVDDIIADFSSTFGGIFIKRNLGPWTKLHNFTPELMATGDLDNNGKEDIVIDFGAIGLWARMNDAGWLKLNNSSPDRIVVADMDGNGADDVVADFGSTLGGLFVKRNLGGWNKLHNFSSQALAVGDLDNSGKDDVIIDFGGIGLWARMNNAGWLKLHNSSPERLSSGDVDGNGADDVLATFGSAAGLWLKKNLGGWSSISTTTPEQVGVGDFDASGKPDIVADFGASGTVTGVFVRRDEGAWRKLHNSSPEDLVPGNLD